MRGTMALIERTCERETLTAVLLRVLSCRINFILVSKSLRITTSSLGGRSECCL